MKNTSLISTIIFSLALCIAAVIVSVSIANIGKPIRTVYVKGLCEIEKPADHVIWPIAQVEMGNNLPLISTKLNHKNNLIVQFLKKGGINDSEISVNSIEVEDRDTQTYTEAKSQFRYKVTQVITVSSKNVDSVRNLIDKQNELLKNEIHLSDDKWNYQVDYSFNDLELVKPLMIQMATKNARATAQKFAEDSDSKIGKIKTASQGQLSINPRDKYTPHIKKLRVVTSVEFFLED